MDLKNEINLLLKNTKLEDQITNSIVDKKGRIVANDHINVVKNLISLYIKFFDKYGDLGRDLLYKDNIRMQHLKTGVEGHYSYYPSVRDAINIACPEFLNWCIDNGIQYSIEY